MATNRAGQIRHKLGTANRQARQAETERRWLAIPIVDRDPSSPGNGQAWAINEGGQLVLRVRIGGATLSLAATATLGKVIFPVGNAPAGPVDGESYFRPSGDQTGYPVLRVRFNNRWYTFVAINSSSTDEIYGVYVPNFSGSDPIVSPAGGTQLFFRTDLGELRIIRGGNKWKVAMTPY